MKKVFIAVLAGFLTLGVSNVNAQVQAGQGKTQEAISLNETNHNFGKVPQGKPVTTTFVINVTGSDSLNLEHVQASCGCTTPEFKAGKYAPGSKVEIKVGYNAASVGSFSKPVTIIYNNGQQKVINISGEVESTPASSAPASASKSL